MNFAKYEHELYLIFRLVFGVLFLLHGLQKFGFPDGQAAPLGTLMWFAGTIEIAVGLAVTIGLYVRWAALLGAAEMLVAYFMVHFPQGMNPLANKGELALLYFAAFLIMAAYGSKK